MQIDNLNPSGFLDDILVTNNNTLYSSLASVYRPIKNITLKSQTYLSYNKFSQDIFRQTFYYTPQAFFSIIQDQTLLQRINSISQQLTLNGLATSKDQFVAVANIHHLGRKTDGKGNFIMVPYEELMKFKDGQLNTKLSYTHINNDSSYFSASVKFTLGRLPGDYTITPSQFDSILIDQSGFKNIGQKELQSISELFTTINYHKKIKFHHFNIATQLTHSKWSLFSAFKKVNTQDSSIHQSTASNDFSFREKEFYISVNDSWQLTRKLQLKGQFKIGNTYYSVLQQKPFENKISLQRLLFLPTFSVSLQASKYNRISLNFNTLTESPYITQLVPGILITNYSTIQHGFDSLQIRKTHNVYLFFSHFDLLNKGLLFYSSIGHTVKPLMLLPNVFPNNNYTFKKFEPVNLNANINTLNFKLEKLISSFISKTSMELNYVSGKSYGLIQSRLSALNMTSVKSGVAIHGKVSGIHFKLKVNYSSFKQGVKGRFMESNSFNMLDIGTDFFYKITKRMFLELDSRVFLFYPPSQPVSHMYKGNSRIFFRNEKGNLEIGLTIINIFNQKSFISSQIQPFQTTNSEFRLMERNALLSFQWKF